MSAAAAGAAAPEAVRRTRIHAGGTQPRVLRGRPGGRARGGRVRARQPRLVRRLGAARGGGRRDRRARGRARPAGLRRDDRAGRLRARRAGIRELPRRGARRARDRARPPASIHDFGGPIGLVWAAMHVDRRRERDADRHGDPARLQMAQTRARLAHAGARRAVPGDGDAARVPHAARTATSRAGCRARSSTGCTTTTTAAPAARCSKLYRATDDPGAAAERVLRVDGASATSRRS